MPEKTDWEKFIEEHRDCPEEIYKSAKTLWQKQVAVEFFSNDTQHKLMEQKLSHHDKLLYAILSVTTIAGVALLIDLLLTRLPSILGL